MAYRLALGPGFRAKELRSMTPASFDLDSSPPTVTVTARIPSGDELTHNESVATWLINCRPLEQRPAEK